MKAITDHVAIPIAVLALTAAAFGAKAADNDTKLATRPSPHVEVHLLRVFPAPAPRTSVFDNPQNTASPGH